ncbi:MAG: OmpA family protein [Muribaculaceae bacterium]|nr:OmpA family protein [Muribaculaceae bacterium]
MMKKILYLLTITVLVMGADSCKGVKESTANEQMERGEYFEAQKTYRKIYNRLTKKEERAKRGEIAFKMAECHRRLSRYATAASAYQNAIRYGYPDSIAQLRLGQMLQATGKYGPAIEAYEGFLSRCPQSVEAKNGLDGCRYAIEQKKNPTRYVVKTASLFNSQRSDFAPMLAGTNFDQLYFTTTSEKVTGKNHSEITGMKNADVWVAKKNEQGQWQRPQPVEGELNTELDEGITAFTPDGSTMYLTKARREPNASTSVEIFTSQRSEAQWSAAQKYELLNDSISAFGHPAISPDGTYLYFASDMPGGSGGKDIWRVNIKERKGSLENLGEQINTVGDDDFPYVRTDSLLYFSSNGHPGLGGLDFFRATLQPDGSWKVENMGMPMNSCADDFGITYGQGESGFLSSNRGDARGYDHIYSFVLPDLKITISGYVLDKDEEPVPNAVIRIVGDDGTIQKEVARTDGSFKFPLQRGVSYVMMAGAKGYLNAKQEFTADNAEEDADYAIDFILSSINKPNVIDNIYYDFDKATLRPESKAALDSLVNILKENPNITIEMASHTDRWGTDAYNLDLSHRRAKSVVDYLIAAGITEDRLQYQGYGESRPKRVTKRIARLFPQFKEGDLLDEKFIETLSDEDQEAADQVNRRTEFQVLSVDYQMY